MADGGKPPWIRVQAPGGGEYSRLKQMLRGLNLHTVCEEAQCPNVSECWAGGTATIMILGDICTRGCRFCAVKSGDPHGELDVEEPAKVAAAVDRLGITYAVITSVDRDDLPDGGAGHYARTVGAVKDRRPDVIVEALIPDFGGEVKSLTKVVEAGPEVIGHNVETVESLTPKVRDRRASYSQSLGTLKAAHRMNPHIYTKSSIMVGLGETENEVLESFLDLREAGVSMLTLGQYLRPSEWHIPVQEYVTPEKFERYRRAAEDLGFLYVAAGPLVRSSYRAGDFFLEVLARRKKEEAASNG